MNSRIVGRWVQIRKCSLLNVHYHAFPLMIMVFPLRSSPPLFNIAFSRTILRSPAVTTRSADVITVSFNIITIYSSIITVCYSVITFSCSLITRSPNVTSVSSNVTTLCPGIMTVSPSVIIVSYCAIMCSMGAIGFPWRQIVSGASEWRQFVTAV